jgi:glycosyltransferase involved in cell wall biosynthesis
MISIIVPAYNEEKGIHSLLENLKSLGEQYEIIVVDDGSTDNTPAFVSKFNDVKLVRHDSNRGYGAALKTGISNSSGDEIIIIDADGTYPENHIPNLVNIMNEGDFEMVVGARNASNVNMPFVRKPAKWFIGKLAQYLSGVKIPDLNSGLRIMKKSAVEKFLNILPNGFSFTTTITLAMLTNGYAVKYTPINYLMRKGKSKIRPIRDTLNFIQLIIRSVLYFNPLKIFVPLSIFLALFAFAVLVLSWLLLGRVMDVTFGVILMTAVMVLAIGMLADLIDKRIS